MTRHSGRVGDAMLRFPKTCPPTTTVDEAREMLRNDHVHALLVVDGRELLAVVERADLAFAAPGTSARDAGRLRGRTIGPSVNLVTAWRLQRAARRRRLAVVDDAGDLLGLLCLKRSGLGFCTDADVLDRARERRRARTPRPKVLDDNRSNTSTR